MHPIEGEEPMKECNDKSCQHQFECKVRIEQFLSKDYLGDGKYYTGTLEKQSLYIFCIKCGESKKIS